MVSDPIIEYPIIRICIWHPWLVGISIAEVRRELNIEEDILLASGTDPAHNLSESQMLLEALAIEEQQYVVILPLSKNINGLQYSFLLQMHVAGRKDSSLLVKFDYT